MAATGSMATGGPTAAPTLGIDLGGTTTLGVVVDRRSGVDRIVARAERPTDTSSPAAVLATVVEVGRTLVGAAGPIGSAGIGTPGVVDAGGVVRHALNLGVGAEGLALGDALRSALDVPVGVENDLNAAALGAGAALGVDDLVLLSIGTGVAAGLLLDGRLRRGRFGVAGEIGHVPAGGGPRCPCGSQGCLEARVSGPAIARRWEALGRGGELFAAAADGDRAAVALRDDVLDDVARALVGLALHLDPAALAVAGGVASAVGFEQALRSALTRAADGSVFVRGLRLDQRLRVVPPEPPIGALGAAMVGRLALGGVR